MVAIIGGILSLIWLGLLIHWIGKSGFYPIAGKGWRTKAFWGVTFLTMNPVLSLLYFIYGVKMRLMEKPPRHLRLSRIIVFSIFALSLPLALPIGRLPDKTRIVTDDSPLKALDLSSKATVRHSSNSISVGGSFGFENITYLDTRRIAILNKSTDPLAVKIAEVLQQYLIKSPAVDEVSYYPSGCAPRDGTRLPGIYIMLDVDRVGAVTLPMMRMTNAKVDFRVNTSQSLRSPWQPLPIGNQSTFISIDHKSTTIGYESYAAKYMTASEDIVNTFFASLKSMMGGSWYASLPQPQIPDYALGTYTPTPTMPFDDRSVREMISGYDLLTHNHTTWWFEEIQPTEEALAKYREALEADGWEDEHYRDTHLRMHRGNETLRIYRSDNVLKKGACLPMIALYRNPFSAEETDALLSRLLNDDVPPDTLLFFGRQYRESESTDIIARFRRKMQSAEPESMQGHLELARFWESQNEEAKAREELSLAAAGLCVREDGSAVFELERVAEQLDDPGLVTQSPSETAMQTYGLIPLDSIITTTNLTVTPDKPIGLYLCQDLDEQADDIRTYVYRIVRDPFRTTPVLGRKAFPNRYWTLVYNGNQSNGIRSYSVSEGQLIDGLWSASMSEQVPEPLNRIQVEITQVGTERFELTITPVKRELSSMAAISDLQQQPAFSPQQEKE